MVRIKCPSCGAVQDLDDSLRGQVSKCAACSRYLRFPAAVTQPPGTTALLSPPRLASEPIPAVPARPAPPLSPQGLDTSIRSGPQRTEAGPFAVYPASAAGPVDRSAIPALVQVPDLAGRNGETSLGEDAAAEVRPAEKKRGRRKKKDRRKRQANFYGSSWRYYTGTIDSFGWVVIGLIGLWLACLVLALLSPGKGRWLLVVGNTLLVVGNIWIGFVAYRDSQVFGMLCFGTCLFTYAYIFMNLEETWRPASLTGLGFLFIFSGLLVSHTPGVPVPTM